MKILAISPICSHPQNCGSKNRIFVILKNLQSLGHEVYFACEDRESNDNHSYYEEMKECWNGRFYLIPFRPKLDLAGRIFRELKTLALADKLLREYRWRLLKDRRALNFPIDYLYNPLLDDFIKKTFRNLRFDAVMVEYVWMSKALENFSSNVLKIIDTNDVCGNRTEKFINKGLKPDGFFSTSEEQEAKGLGRADIVIAIQEDDEKYFKTLTDKKTATVGHIVDIYEQKKWRGGKNIIFVGCMNSANFHGMNHFIGKIWPKVLNKFPDSKLIIAGNISKFIKENVSSVIKLGEIKNIKEAYDMADIAISPIFAGTGLKIKNIEALGYGKPLLTTVYGAVGLDDKGNTSFLVCKTDDEFTENIEKLFTDEDFFNGLAANASAFAIRYNLKNFEALRKIFKNAFGADIKE
jgi:hypothetical protein